MYIIGDIPVKWDAAPFFSTPVSSFVKKHMNYLEWIPPRAGTSCRFAWKFRHAWSWKSWLEININANGDIILQYFWTHYGKHGDLMDSNEFFFGGIEWWFNEI